MICSSPSVFELLLCFLGSETVVLGAMAVPGARSRICRRTAGRNTWCARAAKIGSTSTEHRRMASCAKGVVLRSSQQDRTQSPMPSWNSPVGLVAASISMPSSQRVSTCSRRIPRQVNWLRCSARPGGTVCLQLLGILQAFLLRWSTRLGKECAVLSE